MQNCAVCAAPSNDVLRLTECVLHTPQYRAQMAVLMLPHHPLLDVSPNKQVATEQRRLCEQLGLHGRLLIAEEGINGDYDPYYKY